MHAPDYGGLQKLYDTDYCGYILVCFSYPLTKWDTGTCVSYIFSIVLQIKDHMYHRLQYG